MAFWLQLAILLAAIVLGARRGGMALGPMGGLGLFVFVFLFGLPPGNPPGTVLGMILAVITALSLMEAAGGLDLVVASRRGSSAAIPVGHRARAPRHLRCWSWPRVPST